MTVKKRAFYNVDKETRKSKAKDDVAIKFSERFEKQLHKHGFTQIAFSEKSELSSGAISKYCNGTSMPGFYELRDIAKTLNISSDYLLGISDVPSLNRDIQSIAKQTGLSETSIRYLNKISKKTTSDIETPQKITNKTKRAMTEISNGTDITDKYRLHALNFILEYDKEYNFLELIGKYLFSTTIPTRSIIDIIEEASDVGIPRDNTGRKNDVGLEQFKNMIQEITYTDISSFEKEDSQSYGRLSQNEIHNAILVSLNNALSEANKQIRRTHKEIIEEKIEERARNYRDMYNDPYFHTAVSLEEDIITFLHNSDITSEQIMRLQNLLSDYVDKN